MLSTGFCLTSGSRRLSIFKQVNDVFDNKVEGNGFDGPGNGYEITSKDSTLRFPLPTNAIAIKSKDGKKTFLPRIDFHIWDGGDKDGQIDFKCGDAYDPPKKKMTGHFRDTPKKGETTDIALSGYPGVKKFLGDYLKISEDPHKTLASVLAGGPFLATWYFGKWKDHLEITYDEEFEFHNLAQPILDVIRDKYDPGLKKSGVK